MAALSLFAHRVHQRLAAAKAGEPWKYRKDDYPLVNSKTLMAKRVEVIGEWGGAYVLFPIFVGQI